MSFIMFYYVPCKVLRNFHNLFTIEADRFIPIFESSDRYLNWCSHWLPCMIAVHDFHDIFIRMTFTTRVQLGNIAVVLAHCPKSIWPLLENTTTRPILTTVQTKIFIVHTKNALPYIWIVRQNCLTIQTNSWACLV